MTTKLKWRLSKLPSVEEINDLKKHDLITKEEAREILFTQETEEDREKLSLETEIKFLRNLIEKLSNRTQIIETIREVHTPYRNYGWYAPYQNWCNVGGGGGSGISLSSGSTTDNSSGSFLVANGTAGNTAMYYANAIASVQDTNFSDIKTF